MYQHTGASAEVCQCCPAGLALTPPLVGQGDSAEHCNLVTYILINYIPFTIAPSLGLNATE